jgi:serine/threonine protein kinase
MDESQNPTLAAVAASKAEDDWSGRIVGKFTIIRRLGGGGMGQVFLAEQQSLKRKVAIKVLRAELAANEKARQRFEVEAKAVAALTHPNIVQVYDSGEHEGIPYMVLEYVEGRNLRDFLNRRGPPDLIISLAIIKQVAAALQKAGEQNFVHRDIKPENILLSYGKIKDKDGKIATRLHAVKVADFGLSRCLTETEQPLNITQSGVAMGTPLYMSPEQVHGKPADQRSDIYSFGVTCFHMLSGQPPFRGSSAFDVAVKHIQNEPPLLSSFRPDLPPELCALVHKMMAKKPDDRYQTAKEILRDLVRLRGTTSSITATRPMISLNPDAGVDSIPTVTEAVTSEFEGFRNRFQAPRIPRPILIAAMVVVFLGMIVGGITLRFITNRIVAGSPEKIAPTIPEPPVNPVISSDERFALEAAKKFADPRNSEEVRQGLYFQIDLTLYYFKHHRLDDAEKFLTGLRDRTYRPMPGFSEHPYIGFAKLGLGLVWAFRDEHKKSIDILTDVIPRGQPLGGGLRLTGFPQSFVIDHFELRRVLAEALNRNAKNMHVEKFPEANSALEPLRKPPEFAKTIRSFGKSPDLSK